MARAFLLTVLAVGARSEERRFQDAEVAASQRFFMVSWRDQFNLGHAEYCGHSYVRDAALHVSLGPAAADLARLAGFSDPTILRGKDSILRFWNTTQHIAGLSRINPVEDEGEYATTSFVVDDNHVIVSGRLVFDAALGQTLSQEWVRVGDDDWKIKSDMLAFQELRGPLGQPAALPAAGAEAVPSPPPVPAALPAAIEPLSASAVPTAAAPADAAHPISAAVPKSEGVPAPPGAPAATGDGEDFLLMLGVAAACVLAFIFVRRRKKREAAIAGFDAMLG